MVYNITLITGSKMTPSVEEHLFRVLHEHGFDTVYLDTAKPAPGAMPNITMQNGDQMSRSEAAKLTTLLVENGYRIGPLPQMQPPAQQPAPGAAIVNPQPSAGPWGTTSDPFAKAFKEAPFVSGTGRVLAASEVKVTFSGKQGSGKSQLQRLLLEWCDTHSTATNCTGPHEMIVNTENLNLVTWPKAELAEAVKARNGDTELREAIKRQGDHLAGFAKDLTLVTEAGVELCHAALHVVTEFDGVHSLALAASRFMKALADRGGRGEARTANLPDMT